MREEIRIIRSRAGWWNVCEKGSSWPVQSFETLPEAKAFAWGRWPGIPWDVINAVEAMNCLN